MKSRVKRDITPRAVTRKPVTHAVVTDQTVTAPDVTEGIVTGLSKQRRWQVAQVTSGKCRLCGRPRSVYADVCDEHAVSERVRHRGKWQPWRPGGRGRPPLVR